MKLFIFINEDRFFLSHRLPLAKEALRVGYDVTLVAKNTGLKDECINSCSPLGNFKFIDFPINPTGMNLFQEIKTLIWIWKLCKKERPDVVHFVGLKCILWGGLAAKLSNIPVVINAVSGLGVMFSGPKLGVVAKNIFNVIRYSSNRNNVYFIFQNNDDKSLFLRNKVISEDQCRFVKGSGVDLSEFDYSPEPNAGKIKVILSARMVREKGICDLVSAAELLRNDYSDKVEFLLCGGLSSNPKALKKEDLESMCDGSYIKWLGFRSDVKELLRKSHIVAFPSYYREGVPKSLIEASAIGRPIITCNSVGCKDVVEDGVNGFLIEPRDVNTLASKLQILIDNPSLRIEMGKKSREFAVRDFSIERVVSLHMDLYKLGEA